MCTFRADGASEVRALPVCSGHESDEASTCRVAPPEGGFAEVGGAMCLLHRMTSVSGGAVGEGEGKDEGEGGADG